jgi:general secretion pathway protein N
MRWRLLGLGIGAYAIGLIAAAPATLVDAGLQRASDGRLRLAEAQGTLWSGAGQIEIRAAGGRTGVAKSLAWLVLPASLLRGHLVCEVELDQAARRFPVTISLSRIELAGADINLPAAVLGLAVPKLAPLRLTGDARLHVESLSVGRGGMQGNATLQWLAAGSALTPVSPLGDYELRLKDEGAMVHASLRTLHGPLQLDGKGSWAKGGPPVFLATARIPPQHQQQLAPLLRLIAVERGDGSFELQVK